MLALGIQFGKGKKMGKIKVTQFKEYTQLESKALEGNGWRVFYLIIFFL